MTPPQQFQSVPATKEDIRESETHLHRRIDDTNSRITELRADMENIRREKEAAAHRENMREHRERAREHRERAREHRERARKHREHARELNRKLEATREQTRKIDRDLRIMRVLYPIMCVVASVLVIALTTYLIVTGKI